jgi:hypothetical protein
VTSGIVDTAPPFILWWSKLEILFGPPPPHSSPFIDELRCQAIQTEHGPYIQYSRENPKSSLYCEMSIWFTTVCQLARPPRMYGPDWVLLCTVAAANCYDLKISGQNYNIYSTKKRHIFLNNLCPKMLFHKLSGI